jgi:8-oxo-dGTP pyrophosphatase MutT (NUDIX family)
MPGRSGPKALTQMLTEFEAYQPADPQEGADLARIRVMMTIEAEPWHRSIPLHLTASAVIVHPGSGRILLRWHERLQAWLQVGGHGDPGEHDPVAIALREAAEETGLPDLVPFPGAGLIHVVIVSVPAGRGEPAHEHADLRYVLATDAPDRTRPENPAAQLRWLTPDEALALTSEANLRETISRVRPLTGR